MSANFKTMTVKFSNYTDIEMKMPELVQFLYENNNFHLCIWDRDNVDDDPREYNNIGVALCYICLKYGKEDTFIVGLHCDEDVHDYIGIIVKEKEKN